MTYEEAIKYKNEKYPDGTIFKGGKTLNVVVVPNNQKYQEDYIKEVYQSLDLTNNVKDELAKSFSPDGDYGLCGFTIFQGVIFHITII